jgi:ribose transport system ATP-binding protein
MRSRAEELFEHLGLRGIDPGRQVRDLSMAARQLVAIAKVLAYDPAVLVLDEATSALGPAEVSWLLDRARHLATSGKGIIFISHRLAEVQAACDRVTVLRNGQSVGTWQLGDVGGEDLVSAMLGRRLAQLYPPRRSEPTEKVLLSVSNLSTSQRLRGVNLELHSGEILGMCGLEGQGQLDLFLALFGVVRGFRASSIPRAMPYEPASASPSFRRTGRERACFPLFRCARTSLCPAWNICIALESWAGM